MKKTLTILSALLLLCPTITAEQLPNANPAIPSDPKMEKQIRKIISKMTLEEKAGQMMQLTLNTLCESDGALSGDKLVNAIAKYKIGSILNIRDSAETKEIFQERMKTIQDISMKELGIPCLYGLDMIHGVTYYETGTLFPQEINLGATFEPSFASAMGEVTAYETRAGMVPWVFSPVMDLERNAAWSRNYESFGEDPLVQSRMAAAEVRAMQGEDPNRIDKRHCAVSIKHYMGYGATKSGLDRTPAYIDESDLRDKFFAPFKASIEAGALTLMVNSASINGLPTHANYRLLTGWAKQGLNWDGMIVTDWADIRSLYDRDHLAASEKEAVAIGINAGIDMIMDPVRVQTCDLICQNVREGAIPMERIDDAVARVLRVKFRLGLFDAPVWDCDDYTEYNSPRFVDLALRSALESEVLLKNDGVLPLAKGTKILLCGPNANSIRTLNGGWSYTWQGSDAPRYVAKYNTIYEALCNEFGCGNVDFLSGVVYSGANWENDEYKDIDLLEKRAEAADVIVLALGENTYCETPGNIVDLNLSEKQMELWARAARTGKKVVVILNEGRSRIIEKNVGNANAIVDIMLPGNYGADALALLLSGKENFSGKLPFTYPSKVNSLHTYDFKPQESRETMSGLYNYEARIDLQWPFGYGLSYTRFEYSNLKIEKSSFGPEDTLRLSVEVSNVGARDGKEAVLVFVSDLFASRIMPDVKRLRDFRKVEIPAGQKVKVEFEIPASDLAYVDGQGQWILEKGDFRVGVGGLTQIVSLTETKIWNTQNK